MPTLIFSKLSLPSVRWRRVRRIRALVQPLVVIALFLWCASVTAGPYDVPSHGPGMTQRSMDAGRQIEQINRRVMELTRAGNYSEATVLAADNLDSALSVLGKGHPHTDTALDNLAFLYEMQERDTEAEPLLAQLADLRTGHYGREHPLTAMVLRRLAMVYVRLGRAEAAEALLQRVIPIFETQLGAADWTTIAAITELARLRDEQGSFQDAERLYRRALTALEDGVGRHHQDTASILSDLGALYARQERFGDAERYLSEALEIQNARLGPESVAASFTRTRLAWIYMQQRRYPSAERIFRQYLAIVEAMDGPDHAQTARALTSLSYALSGQKKYAEAEQALTRSLAIFRAGEGPQSGEALQTMEALTRVREEQGRLDEAAILLHDLIELHTTRSGATAPETTSLQLRLAWLRSRQGAHEQAETLFREVLATRQTALGAGDPATLEARSEFANFLRKRARYTEAMELFTQNLEGGVAADDPVPALDALVGISNVLLEQGRYDEAEAHLQQAIAKAELLPDPGRQGQELSTLYNNLATVYQSAGNYSDAKEALLTSIRFTEEAFGAGSTLVATALQNLATLYTATGDYEAAQKLFARALSLYRPSGSFHAAETAQLLGNLANLYLQQGNLTQAELAVGEALQLGQTVLGERHPLHGMNLNTAALLAQANGDVEGAERYLRQALAIFEQYLGPQHPNSTRAMSNLGTLLVAQKRFAEAWPLLERAQAGIEAALGPAHPDTANGLAALAYYFWEKGDLEPALPYIRRANDVFRAQPRIAERRAQTSSNALGPQSIFTLHLDILAALLDQPGQDRTTLTDEAFRVGQQMRQTSTAGALQRTAARFAAGTDELARAVREHQDLSAAWQAADAELTSSLSGDPGSRDIGAEQALRARLGALQQELEAIEKRLRLEFPRYAQMMHPTPLGVSDTQALLRPSEALVAYVIGPRQSYAWVLHPDKATFYPLGVDASELRNTVAAVRLGLDPRSGRGARRLGVDRSTVAGFSVGRVQKLYATIWMPLANDLDNVEHVVVVPDGPLQSLPFAVLVEQDSEPVGTTREGLRDLHWLIRRHAFSQLPAVSSLKALRTMTSPSAPGKGFVGFGDPQLAGGTFRHLRLAPLPESAEELRALARLVDAADVRLYLEGEATERQVRSLDFAGVGVLAFATHGLMAGEADGLEEPGLVLTPPDGATEADDGFLSASEVAELKLNLDWVILSACNTAASDGTPGGEGLSGLARSFFYAGARSMLVSHWSVYSAAAVDITTGMLRAMAAAPDIGRAEALRRSLIKLIEEGDNPHPSYWAPFVLVGDGRISQSAAR